MQKIKKPIFNLFFCLMLVTLGILVSTLNPNLISDLFNADVLNIVRTLDLGSVASWVTLLIAISGYMISRSSLKISENANKLSIFKLSQDITKDVSTYTPPLFLSIKSINSKIELPQSHWYTTREIDLWLIQKKEFKYTEISKSIITSEVNLELKIPVNNQIIIREIKSTPRSEIILFNPSNKILDNFENRVLEHGGYRIIWRITRKGCYWIYLNSIIRKINLNNTDYLDYFNFYDRKDTSLIPSLKIVYSTSYNPGVNLYWEIGYSDSITNIYIEKNMSHSITVPDEIKENWPILLSHHVDNNSVDKLVENHEND